ncbi:ATP-dependent bile acid permease, partial [Zancudomyces culisetae]
MTSSVAFTSLAVFSILKTVFDMYPGFLTWSLGGLVSLRRIEGFIGNESYNLPDMKRKHTSESSDSSKDAATRNEYDFGFIDATLSWDYSRSQKKDKADENTPLLTPAATPSSSTTVSLSTNDENDHGSTGSDGDKKSNFKLRNLNIKFPKNKLTIIAGKIGSGKTSILRALIGEMKLVDGYIKYPTATTSTVMATHPGLGMNAMIGYVPQESWLRNATVRDNILFGSEYDVERYEQVLKMTALKADFRQLVNGDQSQVGERGITLSGGQKQRISLARAL